MATCREALGVHKPGPWSGGDDSELDVFAAERYFNGDDALWCARSSSSFSSAFRTNEHDASVVTVTAATSSSEASWNSRSALLTGGNVHAAAATTVEAEESERTGEGKPRPCPPPLLRRWILGVAGCACLGGEGESLASADDLCRDEVVEDYNVDGNRAKKLPDGVERQSKELTAVEATSVRVRPGRWLDGGDEFQVHLGGNGHRRAVNSCEFPTPILNPATTAGLLPEYRRKSSEILRFPLSQIGSALLPTKQDSTFTIVAGNTTCLGGLHAAGGGGGGRAAALGEAGTISRCDSVEDDAAPSELGCAYPPSEASVVWSVVTAEGAASCNFSSAASGYYYRFNGGEDSTTRHTEAEGKGNRRRGSRREQHHGGLLTCMGDKAVNAVRPAHRDNRNRPSAGHLDVNCRR